MTEKFFFHRQIALSIRQKNGSPFGEAYNCTIYVGLPYSCRERGEEVFRAILWQIDHRAIGIDIDLGFEPTFTNLVRWVSDRFKANLGEDPVEVILERGDGTTFKCS